MTSQNVCCEIRLSLKHLRRPYLLDVYAYCCRTCSPLSPCCHLTHKVSNQGSICLLLSDHQTVWPHAMQMNSKANRFLALSAILSALQILTALHQQSNITIIVSCCEVANQLINAFFLSIRLTENIEPILMFDFVIHVMVRWRESSDYVWPLKSVLRALVLTRTFLFYPEIT